jgi:hypothetical protein
MQRCKACGGLRVYTVIDGEGEIDICPDCDHRSPSKDSQPSREWAVCDDPMEAYQARIQEAIYNDLRELIIRGHRRDVSSTNE